jgi:hypothetical protein
MIVDIPVVIDIWKLKPQSTLTVELIRSLEKETPIAGLA